jgi:glycosyltransferase involved in cell wall biosynthesis
LKVTTPEVSEDMSSAIVCQQMSPPVKFSLILATVGRTAEVENFLANLDNQLYRHFEVIVVDQNEDDRLEPILRSYRASFPITYARSARGLSCARNIGLRYVSGNVIAFPDDDCWYDPDTLSNVASLFLDHPDWDGIAGRCKTPADSFHFLDRKSGCVDKFNVWRRAVSITIFLRDFVVKQVGMFDERLGIGADSGFCSGEETDYLLRALEKNYRIYYQPHLVVNHVDVIRMYDDKLAQKGYSYGRGMGYILRKHRYPLWYVGNVFSRALGGVFVAMLTFDTAKAKFYCSLLRGRLSGWLA